MATATARVTQPAKQKGRPVAGRPFAIHISSNNCPDTRLALQMQRLRLLGIIGARADVVADLAWGVSQ